MRSLIRRFTTLSLCLLIPYSVAAQESDQSDSTGSAAIQSAPAEDTVVFAPDSLSAVRGNVADTINYEQRKYQNPTVALFKSMVIPGWGQLGNRAYIKALIFAGFQAWFVSSAIHHGQLAADARRDWEQATTVADRNRLYDVYDAKRDDRNRFIWFAGITAFVAMFDAYVDAHLSGSPERGEGTSLAVDVAPRFDGGVEALLRLKF